MCLHGKKINNQHINRNLQIRFFKVINVLGLICAEVSYSSGRGFYSFVATSALWITGILLLIYIFRFNSHVPETVLTTFEIGFSAIWVLLYIIAMFWMLIFGSGAASFFAFAAIFTYGYYGWIKGSPYFERAPTVIVIDRNTNNVV
jgi:hypothetical protein